MDGSFLSMNCDRFGGGSTCFDKGMAKISLGNGCFTLLDIWSAAYRVLD